MTSNAMNDHEKAPINTESLRLHLQRIRALATLLDNAFRVPGTNFRIGWDNIIGLIPGVGDVTTGIASASIVGYAMRLGVRKRVLARMLANLGADVTIGAIPLIGDLFDAAFKSNMRNVALLERELARRLDS
jgi:hypothetical protein